MAVAGLVLFLYPVLAQNSACPKGPPLGFTIERSLKLSNILSSSFQAAPADFNDALQSGALEVRSQFVFDAANMTLSGTDFLAQPDTPGPVPAAAMQTLFVLGSYRLNIDRMYTTCQPARAVMVVGRVSQNFPVNPVVGSLLNSPAVLSFGFTADTPAKVTDVVTVLAGVATAYADGATGVLSFPAPPPPPPPNNAPIIVFSPGAVQSTSQKQLGLDASKSTSPLGLELTFSWRQVNTNQTAALSNGNTATPVVTFGTTGDYVFEVTVTDSAGNSSKAETTVSYYGQ